MKKFGESWISYGAAKRAYNELADFSARGVNVKILQHKESPRFVIGVIDSVKKIDKSPAWKCVFSLKFKEYHTLNKIPAELTNTKILQVDYVESSDEIDTAGLAPFTYMVLVQDGYTIISDTAQFNGGIGLWKKLARESGFVDMQVNLLDDEFGFTKDASGKLVNYDGVNIQKQQIWTDGQNMTGEHTLLVLTIK